MNWNQNSTLAHYTQYKPSELCDCVKALHRLFSVGPGSNLPAIREKYSQHKVTDLSQYYATKFLQLLGKAYADADLLYTMLSSVQICREEAMPKFSPRRILPGRGMLAGENAQE